MNNEFETITLDLDDDQIAHLDTLARERGVSVDTIVEDLLRDAIRARYMDFARDGCALFGATPTAPCAGATCFDSAFLANLFFEFGAPAPSEDLLDTIIAQIQVSQDVFVNSARLWILLRNPGGLNPDAAFSAVYTYLMAHHMELCVAPAGIRDAFLSCCEEHHIPLLSAYLRKTCIARRPST